MSITADLAYSAAQHLRLALFGVIARVIESCTAGDVDAALELHPFLAEYLDELRGHAGDSSSGAAEWWRLVCDWETEAVGRGVHLPLAALHRAGLSALELELLLTIGLVEEDPRFGGVFEHAQREGRRPAFGLLMAWWRAGADDDADDGADQVRTALQHLVDVGLVDVRNADAPRAEWVLAPVMPAWDALRGDFALPAWLHAHRDTPAALDSLILPADVKAACGALAELLGSRPAPLLLLRGPVHNGRKTLARALAGSVGRPVVVARDAVFEDAARWRLLGALSAMTNALPILECDLAPGESRTLPPLPLSDAPVVVVTGRHGAWMCGEPRPVLSIDLPLPSHAERARHWQASLPPELYRALPSWAGGMRLSSGSIRSVAAAASGFARLAGRAHLDADDLLRGCRTLQAARLETVATRLPSRGNLQDLAVEDATREELCALLARCRWREDLAMTSAPGTSPGLGVRALFGGPSGSGKTLAARLLASELGKELYRLDLAATVNKYLGETEKNLNRALCAAEELDVVLLIDEGDALMANRTDVASSNDRYANLETNFLLQRLESFEGIVVVTTNAADRIDRAFARRMDVVINFRAPDPQRRFEILKLHLPDIELADEWVQEAASRCALSGGQWRNVVTHARLLALQDGRVLDETHLESSIAREYRKTGATCPLRPMPSRRWR